MAEPKVTAQSELGEKKIRKARTPKAKPSNYDQALAMAQRLNLEDKANLVKELRRQLLFDRDCLTAKAKETDKLLEGI